MTSDVILRRLEAEFDSPPEHIRAIVDLCANGATASFIALFRRDECGDLGETRVHEIADRYGFLAGLDLRKQSIRERLEGGDTPALELGDFDLADCYDRELLDDIDHALRPSAEHASRARAERLGLTELVQAVQSHELGDATTPQEAAAKFVRAPEPRPVEFEPAEDAPQDVVLPETVTQTSESAVAESASAESAGSDATNAGENTAEEKVAEATVADVGSSNATDGPVAEAPVVEGQVAKAPVADGQVAEGAAAPAEQAAGSEGPEASVEAKPKPAKPKKPRRNPDSLENAEAVLEHVVRALSERYGEDPQLRKSIRAELSRGNLTARAADVGGKRKGKKNNRGGGKGRGKRPEKSYDEFFDFSEPVRRIAAPRLLTLRKAEREGIVRVRLELPEGRELEIFRERFSPNVQPDSPLGQLLDVIYRHSYEHHVHNSCEGIVRHELKEVADRETVQTFARALRAQLMSPPLGRQAAMAVRASSKAVWVASVKADGSLGPRHTLGLAEPGHHEEAAKVLAETIREVAPRGLAIPHGRGLPMARKFVDAAFELLDKDALASALKKPMIVSVDETAAMVYATGATARRKLPGTDTGMRATISLVRRLFDPLRELIRVEPRGLGLGQNLTEVHQGLLTRTLESVSGACLARVGVDVNRGDTDLLALIPGLNRDAARAIVEHRNKNGVFAKRTDVAALDAIDDKTFEQVGGSLRVFDGENPLDATSIHPSDFGIIDAAKEMKGVELEGILGSAHHDLDLDVLCEKAGCGRLRVIDALLAAQYHGIDQRGTIEIVDNPDLRTIEDVHPDKQLNGRVTNLTEFGAFIDLGIGTDGLVHISQIPASRIRDTDNVLRVGEIVNVFVVGVDPKQGRISLSMHKPRHVAEGRNATVGERMGGGGGNRRRGGQGQRDGGGRSGGGRGGRSGGPGGGQGQRESQPLTRAAREPEGRRGGRRGAPRAPREEGRDGGGFGGGGGGRRDDRRGGGGRGGDRNPRVHTIESDRKTEEQLGHKGELKSLSSLKNLLGGGSKNDDGASQES